MRRLFPVPMKTGLLVGDEWHIDFCTLYVIIALWGFREDGISIITIRSSWIFIYFSHLILDLKKQILK